jgi:hypothetical protein
MGETLAGPVRSSDHAFSDPILIQRFGRRSADEKER